MRTVLAVLGAGSLLWATVACAHESKSMGVTLERTGGFAGMQQRLEIDAKHEQLKVSDRVRGAHERPLTPEEAKRIAALVKAAEKAKTTEGAPPTASDTFTVKVWLGDEAEPRYTLRTLDAPSPGDATPLGKLLGYLDQLLHRELMKMKPKPPDAPKE